MLYYLGKTKLLIMIIKKPNFTVSVFFFFFLGFTQA